MTSPVGTPEADAPGRGESGSAGRWLTIVTSVWLVVQGGTFVWEWWWSSDLYIGMQPDTMPRDVFWEHVAISNTVMKVWAVLLVAGPAALAGFAAARGLRSRAVRLGLLAALLAVPALWVFRVYASG
jgi:hypothetical protein